MHLKFCLNLYLNIQKNKCAFDLTKKILPYLEKWQPAKVDGKEVNAIAQFIIDPYFLFYRMDSEVEEKFDIIVSRAVANLNILLELSIPFLNIDGYLIALKGNKGKNEADLATVAMEKLDCQLVKIDVQQLPDNQGERSNLLIKKDRETNSKYPRNYGQIKKSPLK